VVQNTTSMEARIRQADVGEAPVLAALQRRTDLIAYESISPPEAPKSDLDQMTLDWKRRLGGHHSPDARAYVAEVGGLLVGVIVACGDPMEAECGHITRLYVDPQHWGQGIGRSLYERALLYLKQAGYERASLWVFEHNERARSWYERLGWTPTGQRKLVMESGRVADLRYTRVL